MTTQAEQIWNDSERYLIQAAQHLNPRLLRPSHVVGVHDETEWMRISYLFPTLPEKSKTNLLTVRRCFLIATEEQAREKLDTDSSAEYAEAMAEQVARELNEALPSFSDVQREILRLHYLLNMQPIEE